MYEDEVLYELGMQEALNDFIELNEGNPGVGKGIAYGLLPGAGIASLVKGTKFNNDEKYNTGYLKEKYAKYKSKGGTYDFQTWKIKYKNQLIASGVSSLATGHI